MNFLLEFTIVFENRDQPNFTVFSRFKATSASLWIHAAAQLYQAKVILHQIEMPKAAHSPYFPAFFRFIAS